MTPSATAIFWLLISLVVFTACFGGGGDDNNSSAITGDTVLLDSGTQANVVCTAVCAQWGQCGDRTDGSGQVVLAGQGGPAVVNQELIFPNNTPIQIDGQEIRTLQPVTGEPMNMNFYYVIATDGTTKGGWVAGWCVQANQ